MRTLPHTVQPTGAHVLSHIGRNSQTEAVHRHKSKGIHLVGRRKTRCELRSKTVDQGLEHQDRHRKLALLDAGGDTQLQYSFQKYVVHRNM